MVSFVFVMLSVSNPLKFAGSAMCVFNVFGIDSAEILWFQYCFSTFLESNPLKLYGFVCFFYMCSVSNLLNFNGFACLFVCLCVFRFKSIEIRWSSNVFVKCLYQTY